ncbi:hypothetical protein Fmac_024748 [Flemingia macrophylla]|uniref:Uncharacterized protein n=1 Tax=Flemingia macrophylla TaxID=520843 RepID=A0ABD1LQA6_9FABA
MTDLGKMNYFLGMEIYQCNVGIFISQKRYALEVLKKFHMEKCKPMTTPLVANEKLSLHDSTSKVDASIYRSLIGSLLYLSATRPNIMFAASLLSRFMHSPSEAHYKAAKRVLRYIRGTTDYGLWFLKDESVDLEGYADSDWTGSENGAKSTSGYVFSFGSGVFSWNSKKQDVVAQSSAEAEYISTATAATIAIANNPVHHGRTKHIKVKYHAIREVVKSKEVSLEHCCSEKQIADIMTKALSKGKFEVLRSKLGVSKKNLKEEC